MSVSLFPKPQSLDDEIKAAQARIAEISTFLGHMQEEHVMHQCYKAAIEKKLAPGHRVHLAKLIGQFEENVAMASEDLAFYQAILRALQNSSGRK